ncbi:PKD domain-containing protein [Candidatus Woesearchaeota archaeon]|nr:PKD domain-containing protein [Candidatus Woesearchaeota archaeon]
MKLSKIITFTIMLIMALQVIASAGYAYDFDLNLAPTAVLSASRTSGEAPLVVSFIGIGIDPEGDRLEYHWNFGDGAHSSSQNPVHIYTQAGEYRVSLTVEDDHGNTGHDYETIVVKNINLGPSVTLYASRSSGEAPLAVAFTAVGVDPEGDRLTYNWNFDDGTTSTAQNPVHTFQKAGSYNVKVTARDTAGNTDTESKVIIATTSNSAPTVAMSASRTNGEVPANVAFYAVAQDPEGDALAYHWEFGDGAISTLQNPVHTFTEVGTYEVTVTVEDPAGNTGHDSMQFIAFTDNTAPSVVLSASRTNGEIPATVAFYAIAHDPDANDVITYHWEFGDGATSNLQNPIHTFTEVGEYEVVVRVEDSAGNTATDKLTFIAFTDNMAPTVVATAVPEKGVPPLTVIFYAAGHDPEGDMLTYHWEFGDGSTSNVQNPVHTYTALGQYTAKVTVEDTAGNTGTDNVEIEVVYEHDDDFNIPPTAIASANPLEGWAPLTVSFVGIGIDPDGYIVSYHWNFGDGTTSNMQNPIHTYVNMGAYEAVLTVTDDDGATGSDSVTIVVNEQIVPPPGPNDYTIHLYQGWNLISLPVRPVNTDISSVLAGIDFMTLWRHENGQWESYLNGVGGEFTTMEADRGYWIYSNIEQDLTVRGPTGGSWPLPEAWYLAGYTRTVVQPITSSLNEIDFNTIWRWDAVDQHWESYLSGVGGEFTVLEPGRGYWIYSNQAGVWTY